MSSFSICVVLCLVAASVQSYVVQKKVHVSFVDTADPSKGWALEKDVGFLDQATGVTPITLTASNNPPVKTVDRDGLNPGANKCAIGYKKAGPRCVPDEDYEFPSVETGDRDGIAGGFIRCPEGYKRAGSACVAEDSDSEEEPTAALTAARTAVNKCPVGYKQAGSTCVPYEDYDSEEDES